MTAHTALAAVIDQIVAERSFVPLSTGQAVLTAVAATTQHRAHSNNTCVQAFLLREVPMGVARERNEKYPTCAIT